MNQQINIERIQQDISTILSDLAFALRHIEEIVRISNPEAIISDLKIISETANKLELIADRYR